MWNLKKQIKQNENRFTGTENKRVVARTEGVERWVKWVKRIKNYKTPVI